MKNFVYLGTALHMIFLANLSPCNAMGEQENEVPLAQVPVKMQKYQDNENKIIEMPSPWPNTNVSLPPQDIIKIDTIFEWNAEAIEKAKTTFENKYQEADSALLQITESSQTSNAQKGLVKDWPMEVFARGNGPMSKHVQGLIAENNTLKNEVRELTETGSSSSTQTEAVSKEERSRLTTSMIDSELKDSLEEIVAQLVSDNKDLAVHGISRLNRFGVEEKDINTWTQALEASRKRNEERIQAKNHSVDLIKNLLGALNQPENASHFIAQALKDTEALSILEPYTALTPEWKTQLDALQNSASK